MASFSQSTLSIYEQVHRWLSTVEQGSTPFDQEDTAPEASCHTVKQKETQQTREPLLALLNSEQAGTTHKGQHSGTGGKSYFERRTSDQAQLDPPSDSPNLVQKENDRAKKVEDNNVLDASAKYARKQRHQTKADRYEYKDAIEKPSKKRESKTRVKKKSAAPPNHNFQAPNVACERLTLSPRSGPGFLAKGKSSVDAAKRGLPDLTFSEMAFLKRKRLEDDVRFPKWKEQNFRKQRCKSPNHEISQFFSQPAGMRRQEECARNAPSSEPFVSWSASPLQNQRLGSAAQPYNPEGIRLHKSHGSTTPSMVHPPSSNGDNFLGQFTTDALLHGVEVFARREKRCYSLNDLKKLAVRAATDLAGDETPRHDIDTVSTVDTSTNQLRLSILPMSMNIRDSPRLTRLQSQRNLDQTAEDCQDVETGCPGMHPSNDDRGQPHLGRDNQDIDRITSPEAAASRQPVSTACHPRPFGKGFLEMPGSGSSYHMHHSETQPKDGEISLCADRNLEMPGCAANATHPTRPLPAKAAVAMNSKNGTEVLDPDVGSLDGLDEFDRKLLRLGTELAVSDSEVIGDRESRLYEIDVETSFPDVGGSWCESAVNGVPDRQQTHDSFGRQYTCNGPMDNSLCHDCQKLSKSHFQVSQDAPQGFSGFSRPHILY